MLLMFEVVDNERADPSEIHLDIEEEDDDEEDVRTGISFFLCIFCNE